jgi:hypothetical protein
MRRPDRSEQSRGLGSRPRLAVLIFLAGAAVVLAGAPLDAQIRSRSGIVEMVTETLPPVDARDRGSILTRGAGAEPVISASEESLLEAARAAVEEARARNEGSTTMDARQSSPEAIERQKLEILGSHESPSLETIGAFPDAARLGN